MWQEAALLDGGQADAFERRLVDLQRSGEKAIGVKFLPEDTVYLHKDLVALSDAADARSTIWVGV